MKTQKIELLFEQKLQSTVAKLEVLVNIEMRTKLMYSVILRSQLNQGNFNKIIILNVVHYNGAPQ